MSSKNTYKEDEALKLKYIWGDRFESYKQKKRDKAARTILKSKRRLSAYISGTRRLRIRERMACNGIYMDLLK